MRIALVGYGRMGQMTASIIRSSDDDMITAVIDPRDSSNVTAHEVTMKALSEAEGVIDFSSASAIPENIRIYTEAGIPTAIGTTGWDTGILDELPIGNARIIHSGNFSLGVAVFLELVTKAGTILNSIGSYDVSVEEIHHREKADAPSGTALMAAERLLQTMERKTGLQIGNPEGKIRKDLINITSQRTGYVPGIHTVMVDGPADTIEIRHTARTREGFAEGAIRALHWLVSRPAGIYTMKDFTADLTGGI